MYEQTKYFLPEKSESKQNKIGLKLFWDISRFPTLLPYQNLNIE